MALSAPPLASSLPSGFQPTSRTWWVCPSNDLRSLPDGTSHTLTNLSAPQVASLVESGLKQTPSTVSECGALKSNTGFPLGSKSLTSPSSVAAPPPVAWYLRFGAQRDLHSFPTRCRFRKLAAGVARLA